MWFRERKPQEYPHYTLESSFVGEGERLKNELKLAEYRRDAAQSALDTYTAVRTEESEFEGYAERLNEVVSALQGIADLQAVKADPETTIFRRAREQYTAAVKALNLYLFKASPDTPDFAEVKDET